MHFDYNTKPMNTRKEISESGKIISWPQNKVRWLIYYYLVGTIVALYTVMFEEYFFAWELPRLAKVLYTTAFCPIGIAVLSAYLAYRKNRKS